MALSESPQLFPKRTIQVVLQNIDLRPQKSPRGALNSPSKLRKVFKVFSKLHWRRVTVSRVRCALQVKHCEVTARFASPASGRQPFLKPQRSVSKDPPIISSATCLYMSFSFSSILFSLLLSLFYSLFFFLSSSFSLLLFSFPLLLSSSLSLRHITLCRTCCRSEGSKAKHLGGKVHQSPLVFIETASCKMR